MFDFEDLLLFAERNGYNNYPFKYVIKQYYKEMRDCYESMQPADDSNEIETVIITIN